MGLRADSARSQRVSGSSRTDSRRAKSARNPIAVHVKFGDDCASAQPGLYQWTATLLRGSTLLQTNQLQYNQTPAYIKEEGSSNSV